ncbi:MAG: 4-hydroxythreonine-4-phosphate dehydrogenase PdxA, partial [Gemmatimonadetes bacterium]|nr:4-hydroxythreonine-4-phosphate dehydrogenase PdxA [Gemmatimonadota bacterium]
MTRPHLGITLGDPAGIGPEIVARALASGALSDLGRMRLYGHAELFARAAADAGIAMPPDGDAAGSGSDFTFAAVTDEPVPADFRMGQPSAFTGRVAAAAVEAAARDALAGKIDAVVTAPLAKSALRSAGITHPGHTEFLAELSGVDSVAMMFVAPGLRVTLATIHIPLADVARTLTPELLGEIVRLTREALITRAGIPDPSVAVLGLNPHAGEGGLFGDEEARIVEPAVRAAAARGWRVTGPHSADSFFLRQAGEHDAVIALYHDQGLIPVKLLSEGRAVNVTLGLPFVRTSVDHGTAFDIAGKGTASAASLVEAVRLAAA